MNKAELQLLTVALVLNSKPCMKHVWAAPTSEPVSWMIGLDCGNLAAQALHPWFTASVSSKPASSHCAVPSEGSSNSAAQNSATRVKS